MNFNFDNTELAFQYKTNKELKNAKMLFASMQVPLLSSWGVRLMPLVSKLPIKGLLKNTIFKQFVGGENLEETAITSETLAKYGVHTILDYGLEGKDSEESFESTTNEFIRAIEFAATKKHIPFIAVKITGIASFDLLHKLNDAPRLRSGMHDNEAENEIWQRVVNRMHKICATAHKNNIGIMIDAEESWIQDPIDKLAIDMMSIYNKEKAIVFNTFQMYRHDRLKFLELSHRIAQKKGFILGAKLVRGAYMEKERERALINGYPSPIQVDKEATDRDFNLAIGYCTQHLDDISFIVASHNEYSNMLAANFLEDNQLPRNHHHVHFSQLYGMSDYITFNLAALGFASSKYLPFGPVAEVVPYLTRRAAENSSVQDQTGRELKLLQKEVARRKEAAKKHK